MNVVTVTSSKLSANARSAPETSAVAMVGSVTKRKLDRPDAPQSALASSRVLEVRRNQAITLEVPMNRATNSVEGNS